MYSIYTYIWLIFMVNVGKYTIHGSYGVPKTNECSPENGWLGPRQAEPFEEFLKWLLCRGHVTPWKFNKNRP